MYCCRGRALPRTPSSNQFQAKTRMNQNLAEVGKPTRWPPGQSGNPAGKPPGTRTAFSQGFIRDFALVWAEEGLEAVRKVSRPIAARCSISACARGAARLFSRAAHALRRRSFQARARSGGGAQAAAFLSLDHVARTLAAKGVEGRRVSRQHVHARLETVASKRRVLGVSGYEKYF